MILYVGAISAFGLVLIPNVSFCQQLTEEATIEQRLKDTEAALKQSKETLAELHVKYEEQQAAFATYQETAGQEIENLHTQVTKVEKEKREMRSQLEEALSKEQALRQDLHVHKVPAHLINHVSTIKLMWWLTDMARAAGQSRKCAPRPRTTMTGRS